MSRLAVANPGMTCTPRRVFFKAERALDSKSRSLKGAFPTRNDEAPMPFDPVMIVQKRIRPRPSAVDLAYGNQTCPVIKIEKGRAHY